MFADLLNSNQSLDIIRHANGIKLIESENQRTARQSLANILHSPFNVYFLDLNSKILGINEETVKTCGFISEKDSIGRTVKDVFKKNSAETALNNDRIVINNNKIQITDDPVLRFDEIDYMALSIKCPWYIDNNTIIGVFGCSIIIGEQSFSEALSKIFQLGLLTPNQITNIYHDDICLTKREMEVLTHLVKGKTAKQIGELLLISKRTVEIHIHNIKFKNNCSSKSELIDKFFNIIYSRNF